MGASVGVLMTSFLSGVYGCALFRCQVSVSFVLFCCFTALFIVFYWYCYTHHISFGLVRLSVFLYLFAFTFGMFRLAIREHYSSRGLLDAYVDTEVQFIGTVISEPIVSDSDKRRLIIHPDVSQTSQGHILNAYAHAGGNISVSVPVYPEIEYGDQVLVRGILFKPQVIVSQDGRQFDYPDYLALNDVYYQVQVTTVKVVSNNHGNQIKTKLFLLKRLFRNTLSEILPEPESSLMVGLLLGEKQFLGKDLENEFRRVGIIHIVVLSGFNITIIGVAMMKVLLIFPKRYAIIAGMCSIVLFSIMTGATATIVRSAIMSSLGLVAQFYRRKYDVSRALFFAGFIMVLFEPRLLYSDTSFQLSFLSTLGLIYLSPFIETRLIRVPELLRTILVSTLATQIFVLPFLLYTMGQFSLVAPVVNILILPFIPFTMLTGSAAGFFALILKYSNFYFIKSLLATPAYFLLSYEINIVHFFATIPYAAVSVAYFPAWLVSVWYLVMFLFFWRSYGRVTNNNIC